MQNYKLLTDLQWQLLEPLFSKIELRKGGKAHADWRSVTNSILYVLLSGAKWSSIPKEAGFAAKSVAQRWYKKWKVSGYLNEVLEKLNSITQIAQEISFPPMRNRLSKSEQKTLPQMSSSAGNF